MKTLLRSFAGGEVTPELGGRLDIVKYQTGLALARNFITLPHGPATRRPGFGFVNEVQDSTRRTRLMPFSFSASQTAVLEFGQFVVRFHINGGTLLEGTKAITAITQPAGLVTINAHGYTNGQWVYLAGIGGMTPLNGRTVVISDATANNFRMRDFAGNYITTGSYPAYTAGGTAARIYEIATPYVESDVFDLIFTQSADVITITHNSYPAKELRRLGATNWTLTTVVFGTSLPAPLTPSVVETEPVVGVGTHQSYKITAVGSDGISESLASPEWGADNDLTLQGNFNTISWAAVVGAARYNVYKQRGGIYGYMGQTTTLSMVDDNILPDTSQSPPEDIISLNTVPDTYPAAVAYHEQRRWFGGTINRPQVLWATRTGTENNLTNSIPSRDADGMEVRVASNQYNQILHITPLADLIALTRGGEFRIYAEGAPAITPTSISIKVQGYGGASRVQPVVSTGSMLYVQAQGSRVRELAYNWESNAYRSVDMSIMAPHRFNGFSIVQLAYARAPDQLLWAVRDDGYLLGMTYVPDQQVYGWHSHATDGGFESACVVAEGNEDVLYVVARRLVNGRQCRFIERMRSRIFIEQADAFYVDSGLTYAGAPVTTLGGLWHLEGKLVHILTDGAVHPNRTVVGGSVTLDYPASVVHVGLPFTSDMQTLPLALEAMQAVGQGTAKNVNRVHLRVSQSSVVRAGPNFNELRELNSRDVEDPYGSPPALRNGEVEIGIDASWNQDGGVCVRQDLPLPLTVLSMTLEIQTGG